MKQKDPEYIRKRNAQIIDAAQTGQYTLDELGRENNITEERVRQILRKSGYNILDFRKQRKQTEDEKKPYNQQIVDTLMQYYFNRLIIEKGENHSLAWRCQ